MPVLESSIVKLTPEAFLNPTAYLDTAETKINIKRMTDFISGDITTNPGLKVIGVFLVCFSIVNQLFIWSSYFCFLFYILNV